MKILKASDRELLMKFLDLPEGAQAFYENVTGTIYGDTLEDVLRFALILWLHNAKWITKEIKP